MTEPKLVSIRKYCEVHRSYYESLNDEPCPSCERSTLNSISDRVTDRIRVLEERVAFAEQARDNAVRQRDDALERSKAKAKSAGDRISALVSTIRTIMSWRDWPSTRTEAVEKRIAEILSREDA